MHISWRICKASGLCMWWDNASMRRKRFDVSVGVQCPPQAPVCEHWLPSWWLCFWQPWSLWGLPSWGMDSCGLIPQSSFSISWYIKLWPGSFPFLLPLSPAAPTTLLMSHQVMGTSTFVLLQIARGGPCSKSCQAFGHSNEESNTTCLILDERQEHVTEWKKLDAQVTYYTVPSIWNVRNAGL